MLLRQEECLSEVSPVLRHPYSDCRDRFGCLKHIIDTHPNLVNSNVPLRTSSLQWISHVLCSQLQRWLYLSDWFSCVQTWCKGTDYLACVTQSHPFILRNSLIFILRHIMAQKSDEVRNENFRSFPYEDMLSNYFHFGVYALFTQEHEKKQLTWR